MLCCASNNDSCEVPFNRSAEPDAEPERLVSQAVLGALAEGPMPWDLLMRNSTTSLYNPGGSGAASSHHHPSSVPERRSDDNVSLDFAWNALRTQNADVALFFRDAARGLSCTYLDQPTGHRVPTIWQLQGKTITFKPVLRDEITCELTRLRMIYCHDDCPWQLPQEAAQLSRIELERLLVFLYEDPYGEQKRICILDSTAAHRERALSCLQTLKLYADARALEMQTTQAQITEALAEARQQIRNLEDGALKPGGKSIGKPETRTNLVPLLEPKGTYSQSRETYSQSLQGRPKEDIVVTAL